MQTFTKKLHEELQSKLKTLEDDPHSEKYRSERRIGVIIKTIGQILKKLETYQFPTEEEEIYFFKSVLPPVISLLVYYEGKNDWESVERLGTFKARQDFLEQQFKKINDFFKDNEELFRYYRSGKTNLDRYYFLPKRNLDEDDDLLSFLMDPSFCTIYCLKVAIFLGYASLEKDILQALDKKEHGAKLKKAVWDENNVPGFPDKLPWMLPKIALIELIYAFKAVGAFGNADLKTITRIVEKVFNIDLGNITRSYQEITMRKTGQTLFLDQLKEGLLAWIERTEKYN
jgi:RteC protein